VAAINYSMATESIICTLLNVGFTQLYSCVIVTSLHPPPPPQVIFPDFSKLQISISIGSDGTTAQSSALNFSRRSKLFAPTVPCLWAEGGEVRIRRGLQGMVNNHICPKFDLNRC
jgi:hypothetical protein